MSDPTGQDWSEDEIDLIVADYFDMLGLEMAGRPFVKTQRNAQLQALTGRSRGSIEFKHQNISAVLLRLGLPWITGYKPMFNFQGALIDGIERFLGRNPSVPDLRFIADSSSPTVNASARDTAMLFVEAPPAKSPNEPEIPLSLTRLVRKFDPAARDARNRALGRQGEERVLQYEQAVLKSAGRNDLAGKVRWVSEETGDGAGFDVLSFDQAGKERCLEVKTTVGHATTPFFLTENERSFSEERPDAFRIVRLYDFARAPRAFELAPPLEKCLYLRPESYRASFEASVTEVDPFCGTTMRPF
ncbi:MAG: DUF3883 domain-containing protein [Alphaproteobacteria bacterium]|nr:DUF3883 domain-containing protein [Alphaproteobacteria bacterium]